jgi:phytoene dehydrogenase-like protein
MPTQYDAIIIGAGHNELTYACYLAKAGLEVFVLQRYHDVGSMTLTEELTLPGFNRKYTPAATSSPASGSWSCRSMV